MVVADRHHAVWRRVSNRDGHPHDFPLTARQALAKLASMAASETSREYVFIPPVSRNRVASRGGVVEMKQSSEKPLNIWSDRMPDAKGEEHWLWTDEPIEGSVLLTWCRWYAVGVARTKKSANSIEKKVRKSRKADKSIEKVDSKYVVKKN